MIEIDERPTSDSTPPSSRGGAQLIVHDADDDYADLSGLRVLVVDDDRDGRDMLLDLLRGQGAVVEGAGTAAAALAILPAFRPDVLVSDIGLPDLSGYVFLERVRALSPAEGGLVPAIALTGYADLEDSRRALDVGFQVHVAKPVQAALLTQAVANVAGEPISIER